MNDFTAMYIWGWGQGLAQEKQVFSPTITGHCQQI